MSTAPSRQSEPLILGIESSCDETAAAVVRGEHVVLSNVIATQFDLHEVYGGVVPEIASRAHLERIVPVIREAVQEAGVEYNELDAIAVGNRPGLIGSLLVGVSAAKSLAWSLGKPLIGVDHLLAHLQAVVLKDDPVMLPGLGLVVSGGHSSMYLLEEAGVVRLLGKTIDDAVGEAYDKAATILELGYPGGPRLDGLAQQGDDAAYDFPVANLGRDRLDFSFSGLKTALLYAVCGMPQGRGTAAQFERDASALSDREKADYAASFQRAAIGALMKNLRKALDRESVRSIVVGGGVSANSRLRRELRQLGEERGVAVRLPKMDYCMDNAAMIASRGVVHFQAGLFDDWTLSASPRSTVTSEG